MLDLLNEGIHSKLVIIDLFCKKWSKRTKDSFILDLDSNSLQKNLKEILLQQGSNSHLLSTKKADIILLEIQR